MANRLAIFIELNESTIGWRLAQRHTPGRCTELMHGRDKKL